MEDKPEGRKEGLIRKKRRRGKCTNDRKILKFIIDKLIKNNLGITNLINQYNKKKKKKKKKKKTKKTHQKKKKKKKHQTNSQKKHNKNKTKKKKEKKKQQIFGVCVLPLPKPRPPPIAFMLSTTPLPPNPYLHNTYHSAHFALPYSQGRRVNEAITKIKKVYKEKRK